MTDIRSTTKRIMLKNEEYTVGWICALNIELSAATCLLEVEHDRNNCTRASGDDNEYVLGKIGEHNVVIARHATGGCWPSMAARVAQNLMQSFKNVRDLLMVGIGGGAPLMDSSEAQKMDIRLGDVVIGIPGDKDDGIVQIDLGKQDKQYKGRSCPNRPSKSLMEAVSKLRAQSEMNACRLGRDIETILANNTKLQTIYQRPDQSTDCLYRSSYQHVAVNEDCCKCDSWESIVRPPRSYDAVQLHYGVIGSGNTLIKDALIRDELARKHKILCFEMEAAGLMNNFGCLMIRGISDYADSHKNDKWQAYAAVIAAAYTKNLLCSFSREDKGGIWLNDIERWLAAPDPEVDFHFARDQCEPGTGQWLLNSDTYQRWKHGEHNLLWINGKPGCGKSVISATIVQDIRRHCADKTELGSSIFYFSSHDRRKQSYTDCLRSIVRQICLKTPIPRRLEQVFMRSQSQQIECLEIEQDLQSFLLDEIRGRYKQFYLIIDGLDECPENSSNQREKLLDWLCLLPTDLPMLKILAISRPLPDIEARLLGANFHSESLVTESLQFDIGQYIVHQLEEDRRLCDLSTTMKMHIRDTLVLKADNTFLWAVLAMNHLKRLSSIQPSNLENTLRAMPLNLVEMFQSTVQDSPKIAQANALILLIWLTYAHRPLTVLELSETRIIRLSAKYNHVAFDDRGHVEDVLEIFSGWCLAIKSEVKPTLKYEPTIKRDQNHSAKEPLVNRDNQILQLVHGSVHEWLLSCESSIFQRQSVYSQVKKGSHLVAHSCVIYLIYYAKTKSITKTSRDLQDFPLLEYAATFWYAHCQEMGDDIDEEIKFLLSAAFLDILLVHDPDKPWRKPFDSQSEDDLHHKGSHLYYASLIGSTSMVKKLLDAGADVNARGGIHDNALQVAVDRGHYECVAALLEAGADVNARGRAHYTALLAAVIKGHHSIVTLLCQAGADINIRDKHASTALHFAVRQGHLATVKFLLEAGADPNAQDKINGSVLHLAATQAHHSAVKLLIEHGADVNNGYSLVGTIPRKVVATSMKDLDLLYNDQEKLMKAEEMYLRNLHDCELALGQTHGSTLVLLNNLGIIYKIQGKLAEAENMYRRALDGYKATSGHKLSMIKIVNNLGTIFSQQGKGSMAAEMYLRAIQGYEETVGRDDPLTLDVVTNLGSLYSNEGKLAEAEQLFDRALYGYQATLGTKHTRTLNIVNNLGLLYRKQDKPAKAEEMLTQALIGKEQELGRQHISTLNTVSNLGVLYSEQNRQIEAEELLLEALNGYEKAVGLKAMDTYVPALNVMWALGNLYFEKRPKLAKNAYTKALRGYENVQGKSSKIYLAIWKRLDQLEDCGST